MLEVDATILAPKIAQIVSLSGWGLPALDWTKRANQSAKTILDDQQDESLFTPQPVKDEQMAVAVQALLYLWTGWPDDCQMWVGAAPERERLYIQALAYRQQHKTDQSKTCLQPLTENPLDNVYSALARLTSQLIHDSADKRLKRFRDLIKMGQAWEAFAFTDLFEQARDGQFNYSDEEIVRKLQWQEFNLLMHHCYLAVTGIDITKQDNASIPKATTPAWKKNLESSPTRPIKVTRPTRPDKPAATPAQKPEKTNDKPASIRIKCPKCQGVLTLSESSRGQTTKCTNCGGLLRVADGNAKHPSPKNENMIRLGCPKCRNVSTYAESSRGKKVACLKCHSSFLFAA